jgi:ABC-2 type transport system ATP-binding protein
VSSNSANGVAISVKALRKRYGRFEAVKDVDLEVRTGEVFALLGPNGAGKTSTVEILEGFRRRSEGDVRVLDVDPASAGPEWRARVGVVPRTTMAFFDLTVRELVGHFASFYPAPLPPDEVIDMVGLSEKSKTRCADLSGGQKRSVEVALGIIGDPVVLFLDEPTTGLDPVTRRKVWAVVERLTAGGMTTLLTTHDLDEAAHLAHRAGIIIGGRLVEVGTPDELGGRSSGEIAVSFHRVDALAGRDVPPLPRGTSMATDGDLVVLHTRQPTAIVSLLIEWSRGLGVSELPGLAVHRPTLEDVYLGMIRDYEASGHGRPR